MGPLLLGLLLLLIGWLARLPYPLGTILIIAGAVFAVYGLYLIFVAGSAGGRWRWR
jgi:hypothetical protein